MKKWLFTLIGFSITTLTLAAESPLCALPQVDSKETEPNPGCTKMIEDAKKMAETTSSSLSLSNSTSIPSQFTVGVVYLQAVTMAPAGMMRPRDQSDIHLEMDLHAKTKLPSRGFAPGDWLPNADISYTIQKIGDTHPLECGTDKKTTCKLMAMVASDGTHYGDNVKLSGPGFYIVTFDAHSDPMFGWHTDTDSKVLGTEFVDWQFKQSYILKWTGVGKKGGYG